MIKFAVRLLIYSLLVCICLAWRPLNPMPCYGRKIRNSAFSSMMKSSSLSSSPSILAKANGEVRKGVQSNLAISIFQRLHRFRSLVYGKVASVLINSIGGLLGVGEKSLGNIDHSTDAIVKSSSARSMISIVGVCLIVGTIMSNYQYKQGQAKLEKEIIRIQRYKENMYIDAVADILRRLKAENVKPSIKDDLLAQLKQIDPKGEIKSFVESGGPRPDMSHIKQFSKKSAGSIQQQQQINQPALVGTTGPQDSKTSFAGALKSWKFEVIRELEKSLVGKMESETIFKLLSTLEDRMFSISDLKKRSITENRIRDRIGNIDYWTTYCSKL